MTKSKQYFWPVQNYIIDILIKIWKSFPYRKNGKFFFTERKNY